jgi:hypothetical protein
LGKFTAPVPSIQEAVIVPQLMLNETIPAAVITVAAVRDLAVASATGLRIDRRLKKPMGFAPASVHFVCDFLSRGDDTFGPPPHHLKLCRDERSRGRYVSKKFQIRDFAGNQNLGHFDLLNCDTHQTFHEQFTAAHKPGEILVSEWRHSQYLIGELNRALNSCHGYFS